MVPRKSSKAHHVSATAYSALKKNEKLALAAIRVSAAAHLCGEVVFLQPIGALARGGLGAKRTNDQLMLKRFLQEYAYSAFLFLHGFVQRLQPAAQRAC